MIESAIAFLFFILVLTSLLAFAYKKLPPKLQHYLPLVVIIYVTTMLFANSTLFTHTQSINQVQTTTLSNLIPAMIFLMLLQFRFKTFLALGTKLLSAFFLTTVSFIVSFVTVFYSFKAHLFEGANASFAVLAGSWTGGTANMLAVSKAIDFPETDLGAVLAVDTVLYTFWFIFLLSSVGWATVFNRFTKSHAEYITLEESCPIESDSRLYVRIILMAITVAFVVNILAQILPHKGFFQAGFISIILATLLGIAGSFTPLKMLNGTQSVANAMLYLIIALIASKADFTFIEDTGMLFLAGIAILFFHMVIMIVSAKLFKLDLFSVAVASLSHIGGVASAPILAASFHKSLIPVGVTMAIAGYIVGTVVGLTIAFLLGVTFT